MTCRRAAFFLIISILLLQPAFASDWPMSRGGAAQQGASDETLKLPLHLAWQYNAGKFAGNPSAPAVVDGVVYFASGDRLYAVDAETGALKWKYPAEQPLSNVIRSSPAVADGTVYFGCSDGCLYAVSADEGKLLWQFTTGSAVRCSPVVSGNTVFVGSDDDSLYAIDSTTGENIWGLTGFRTGSDIPNAPAAAPGVVIFASMDLNVYGASQSTGKLLWPFRLITAASKSSPVIAENTVYIGSGNMIYGLMLRSGLQKVGIQLPAEIMGTPAIYEKDLYAVCKNKTLQAYTIAGRSAKAKWQQPVELPFTPTCGPTVANNLVLITGEHGLLSGYSTEDGSLKWQYVMSPSPIGGQSNDFANAASSPVVSNGRVYVLTDDGALHCFASDSADNLAPDIFDVEPLPANQMSGQPPVLFSSVIYDGGSGVDPSSVQMLLDGVRVESNFDASNSVVAYETPVTQPLVPLRDGRHVVSVKAADWAGNVKEQEWSFLVDKSMPPQFLPKAKTAARKAAEKKNNDDKSSNPNVAKSRGGARPGSGQQQQPQQQQQQQQGRRGSYNGGGWRGGGDRGSQQQQPQQQQQQQPQQQSGEGEAGVPPPPPAP